MKNEERRALVSTLKELVLSESRKEMDYKTRCYFDRAVYEALMDQYALIDELFGKEGCESIM